MTWRANEGDLVIEMDETTDSTRIETLVQLTVFRLVRGLYGSVSRFRVVPRVTALTFPLI